MTRSRWRPAHIPDLFGKTIVVTGANSGIGLEAVKLFVANGAEVIMACRNTAKAEAAAEQVKILTPQASLTVLPLDLADLESVKTFVATLKQRINKLDVLLNNAGVMAPPLQRTKEGFEMQFGTNHLGHFALTGPLLSLLEAAPAPRIVQISSLAHRGGKILWGNLNAEKRYSRWSFYCQSKLANLIFAKDLHRRLQKCGSSIQVMAAHPGYSATHLQDTVPGGGVFNWLLAQPAEMGCLPGVMAATSDNVTSGGYYGPDGKVFELRGYPAPAFARKITDNVGLAEKLWDESERLTGVRYLSA
ncbi:MAG: short-chain dehydrogenase [Alcanivorax borkumensis]|jgi:NAD(P)-dependent dehydrogenase (short-subunit alcohol dehydrogenase family)|uniref:Oxidoreductase n=1 Tax=Alcanivorax borkumensis (strain ATCC 700651 / DSM 11573 / NCIMB 13689 / SK2) TaxID=393595 RepID=Q0VQS4_ALCBS|nr:MULTISPECIES: oxidoreductase [Alcanivorax]EUC71533.1 short-chain dehydrogenase [Alcanivorax sp. 97CO-5]OJH07014.1 MAG: short-chain dehydrogenase [Alcanivorax borkumensis]PKG02958.1 short-chain dehydrogenase [Alcanivorax sp. 97CO-6]CAL16474.1 oxidoreductase [Alcanivorax borkumensis SK2]